MTESASSIWLVANTSWYLYNFRRTLINNLLADGFHVVALSPRDEYTSRLEQLGVRHVHLQLDNASTNPAGEMLTLFRIGWLLYRESPSVLLTYTPKPNIYGCLAAGVLGIPIVPNIAGLGRAFVNIGWLPRITRVLYRLSLRFANRIFFQNPDDLQLFVSEGLVNQSRALLLPGSGVDLARFSPAPLSENSSPIFVMIARLLMDKGVGEFVAAARLIKARYPGTRFQLLGPHGVANPSAVSREQLERWVREGVVEYLGETDDVIPYIAAADCVVLPSYYREGVPRSLLEAAAMARPVITTDHIGCREAVDDRLTGLLCKIKDPVDLADKIGQIIEMTREQRGGMGQKGREKMEQQFDERIVLTQYLSIVNEIVLPRGLAEEKVS